MSRKKIHIPKEELLKLYYEQKKSKYEIAKIFNCTSVTVLHRMREYKLDNLPRSIIQAKYSKKDFAGTDAEKAYMIGFRLGDLNVYQTGKHSTVIIVRCHTTQMVQVVIMRQLFQAYGRVSQSYNKKSKSYHVNCYLNSTFSFLLPKHSQVPEWISNNEECAAAFAAGYIDAEANIGVYDGRARFKIDSYDKGIIFWFFDWFQRNGIHCPKPSRIGRKNQVYHITRGYKYNKDLWRVRVSSVESLEALFNHIIPYIKHEKRRDDIEKCLGNMYIRLMVKTHGQEIYS